LFLLVVADHMADVLTKEALDALVELLPAVDVDLSHPVALGRLLDGGEGGHLLGDCEVVRHICDEVAHHGKGPHGRHGDLAGGKGAHARHAHEAGLPIDLG
jgi:hypothetical protein